MFASVYNTKPKFMLQKIHDLISEADAVCHYNGTRFDIPVLNKEFLLHHLAPPAPYKQIDLLKVVRKEFRFASNKLDHIAQRLGLGKKTAHEGYQLWVKCMNKDPVAWKTMEKYNKQKAIVFNTLQMYRTDRLDYLKRDSFFTGVIEGSVGSDRIIRMLNVVDGRLVIDEKGIYSVEKLNLMY